MKRVFHWFLVLGLMAFVVVSACAAPKAPAPAPEKPAAERPAAPKAELTREQRLIEAAKANGEKEVVYWLTSWRPGPIERAFEAKYPFLKLKAWSGSTVLWSKILEEYKAGVHTPDVVGNAALFRIVPLYEAGILQEYEWPNAKDWPQRPPHGFWLNHEVYPMLPLYNTNLVPPGDVPRSWENLNSSKWVGKAIISTSGADWLLTYAYMIGDFTAAGVKWDRSVNFWKEVVKTTKPRIVSGFSGPQERVVTGDAPIFLVTAGTNPVGEIRRGAPIEFAPIKRAPASPLMLALTKHPPNPNAARLFLDFLTSEEGARLHSEEGLPAPSYHPRAARQAYSNQYFTSKGVEMVEYPVQILKLEYIRQATDLWVKQILGQ